MPLGAWLIACYAFLYAPIAFLVVFSFNEFPPGHRLVGVFAALVRHSAARPGHDRRSFAVAAHRRGFGDDRLRGRGRRGFALARFGRFRGRTVFEAALAVPLVMPEVITGLSLLLLFVALEQLIGWPSGRGAGTVTVAHGSVSVAYVAVVVRARLADAGVALEQAAMDLYAPPWKAFAVITLPLMAPALVSGWLLAFTLSMDDVVVASFTSGPGASTLPMVVFSATRLGTTPEIYALATVIVAVVTAVLLAVALLARKRAV